MADLNGIPGLGQWMSAPKATDLPSDQETIAQPTNRIDAPNENLEKAALRSGTEIDLVMDDTPQEKFTQEPLFLNSQTFDTEANRINDPVYIRSNDRPAAIVNDQNTNVLDISVASEKTPQAVDSQPDLTAPNNKVGNIEAECLEVGSNDAISRSDIKGEIEAGEPKTVLPQISEALSSANETKSAPIENESSPPPLTHALEELLGWLDPAVTADVEVQVPVDIPVESAEEDENPEWEIDSSPIESSSDDDSSSDDSSSEDSDDEDDAYKLLSPEEQARILMEGDGGSDDEGATKGEKGAGAQLRTKNEVAEEVIPKPDVTITPEMPIELLGAVEGIAESILLIKAKTSGEYRVLETGSVLCLENRSVIGVVAETLGRVQQPLYSVRFTNAGEIAEAGLEVGTKVFYSEQHSTYVFTQALKAYKGSDASNLHDEEVGDEEIEFSDDEAEMEHKRGLKRKVLERRGGKMQRNRGSGHESNPLQQEDTPNPPGALKYDDGDDDGPYKPLSRPAGFSAGQSEAPQEGISRRDWSGRGRGNGVQSNSGRGRGRGDRRQGNDRGRDRGFQDRHGGYSKPPETRPPGSIPPPARTETGSYSELPLQSPQSTNNSPLRRGLSMTPMIFSSSPQVHFPPSQWPQFSTPPMYQNYPYQQPPAAQNVWQPPNPAAAAAAAAAFQASAFFNPAFFNVNQGAAPNPAFFDANQGAAPNQWTQPGQPGQSGHEGGRGRGS
ncbi:hypothetical protein B7494_g8027 [Chlorociboria aeruginascens]|nr:hypothetical protein B7494_g8027 [Chlorociboria aeruginascens]